MGPIDMVLAQKEERYQKRLLEKETREANELTGCNKRKMNKDINISR